MDKILDIGVREMTMYHHHTQEEKTAAIELYIASRHSPTTVKRTLGYPCRSTLSMWYKDYLEKGYVRGSDKWHGKFTDKQKAAAVKYYLTIGKNGLKTVRELGYPSHTLLGQWIDELAPGERKRDKPHKMSSDDEKTNAIVSAYSGTAPIKDTITCAGVHKTTFYEWRKCFLGKEAQDVVDNVSDENLSDDVEILKEKIAELKAEARFHKMEVAVWKGAAELVKKDPGIDPESLSNKEKTILVDALKAKLSLNELLEYLCLPKSSYYYQASVMALPDKYAELRRLVCEEFEAEGGATGAPYGMGALEKAR